jgi:hypothetical protein
MNDTNPLGTHDVINGLGETVATIPHDQAKSIVDNILNLDEFLSGDVRRAEKTARFCTSPELEAKIEELNAELDSLTDSQGRPLPVVDQAVGDGERSAHVVASEIQAAQREYAAAMVSVRFRQIDEDEWTAYLARHKKVLDEGLPYPAVVYEDLISRTAIAPRFTVEQVRTFRSKVGHPVFQELAGVAWAVNTQSGVSVPKSSLSSGVLRQPRPA